MQKNMAILIVLLAMLMCVWYSGEAIADDPDGELNNGSFEDGKTSWGVTGGTFFSVSTPRHDGNRAAELYCDKRCSLSQLVAVDEGARYMLTAWVVKNDPVLDHVEISVEWRDASGNRLSESLRPSLTGDSPDYHPLTTGWMTAPLQAAWARVWLTSIYKQDVPASTYFDAVSLNKLDAPTPTATPTPSPSATPTAPTHTPTLTPSHTPTATRTPRPTSTPTVTSTSTQLPAGVLSINEVLFQPSPLVDPVMPEARREWIEFYNASNAPVTISNWTLDDSEESEFLPLVIVPAKGFAVVAGSIDHFESDYPDFSGILAAMADGTLGNGLANTGDSLVVRDASGREIDAISYGEDQTIFDPACPLPPAGHSLEREPAGYDTDQAGDFVEQETPSPGRATFHEATPTTTATASPSSTPTPTETLTPTVMAGRCWLPVILK